MKASILVIAIALFLNACSKDDVQVGSGPKALKITNCIASGFAGNHNAYLIELSLLNYADGSTSQSCMIDYGVSVSNVTCPDAFPFVLHFDSQDAGIGDGTGSVTTKTITFDQTSDACQTTVLVGS